MPQIKNGNRNSNMLKLELGTQSACCDGSDETGIVFFHTPIFMKSLQLGHSLDRAQGLHHRGAGGLKRCGYGQGPASFSSRAAGAR